MSSCAGPFVRSDGKNKFQWGRKFHIYKDEGVGVEWNEIVDRTAGGENNSGVIKGLIMGHPKGFLQLVRISFCSLQRLLES